MLKTTLVIACLVVVSTAKFVGAQYTPQPQEVVTFNHKLVANQACTNCHTAGLEADQTAHFQEYQYFTWSNASIIEQVGIYNLRNVSDKTLRKHLQLGDTTALLVVAAHPKAGTPALLKDDIITRIDGQQIDLSAVNKNFLAAETDVLQLQIIREGKKLTKEVSTAEFLPQTSYRIGIQSSELSSVLRSQLQVEETTGLVITAVVEASPAESSGLQQHDIILTASGKPICSSDELKKAVDASQGRPIELTIIRHAERRSLVVTPQAQ